MRSSRRVLFSAVVLIGVLGGFEWLCRGQGVAFPAWQGLDNPSVVMVGHPTRLWSLGMGVRENAGERATINGDGLRGTTVVLPRPEGRRRILVLGDSSFFGFGLDDSETLDVGLVAQLGQAGIDVDGINGGVPGYSTEQCRLLLDDVGWSKDPTLLVLGAFWSDTNFGSYRDRDLLHTAAFSTHPLARSAGYRWLASAFGTWFQPDRARIITWTQTDPSPEQTLRRVSLARYAENLVWIADEAANRGIGTVLVSPTARSETQPDMTAAVQWSAYRAAQASVAAHLSIPFVDTRPAFVAALSAADTPRLFLDDLHPTAAGVGVMARQIATALLDAGWPDQRLLARTGGPEIVLATDTYEGTVLPSEERVRSPIQNLFKVPEAADNPGGSSASVVTIMGQISATGSAPITLRIRAAAGNIAASATMVGPGPFQLRVLADSGPWEIEASQGDGTPHRVTVDPDNLVLLALP